MNQKTDTCRRGTFEFLFCLKQKHIVPGDAGIVRDGGKPPFVMYNHYEEVNVKVILVILLILMAGCSSNAPAVEAKETDKTEEIVEEVVEEKAEDPNEESRSPTMDEVLLPVADGVVVYGDSLVTIDYSHADQGYLMAKTNTDNHKRIKIQIMKDDATYNYDINKNNEYETYTFNMGDGRYTIRGLENVSGDRYAVLFTFNVDVQMAEENLPYLYPNQIVDFNSETEAVAKSFELTKDCKTELQRVQAIYDFCVTITYDWDQMEAVQNSYVLPILDETLELKTGICFDYAALMSCMLRVQHIPCKVVTGYVEQGYHAWVEVYIDNVGWINPETYFEKKTWTLVDPTYDSMGGYDGDYSVKYRY